MRNMTNIRLATVALLLILPGFAFSPHPVKADGNPSASGHGTVVDGDSVRFFSFNAVQHDDGTVTGQAEVHNLNTDVRFHVELDCLKIDGNTATISGIVTESDPPVFVGLRGTFRVEDNGEGDDAPPDRLSRLNLQLADCNASFSFPGLAPIFRGNIQVRP